MRGDEYQALKQAQDLARRHAAAAGEPAGGMGGGERVGVLAASPDGFTPDVQAEVAAHLARASTRRRTDFENSMDFWASRSSTSVCEIRFVEMGGDAGNKFFDAVNDELQPADRARAIRNRCCP